MNASYLDNEMTEEISTFELFIRRLPEDWGYFIAAGIDEAIDYVLNMRFTDDDIQYLTGLNRFKPEYLDYLREFRFTGDIKAIKEGTPFTANTPIIRVTAKRHEAQLVRARVIDTYDTLEGARNAVVVGKEMEAAGRRLQGVRLDSGDMEDLAFKVRSILDSAGLGYVKIVLSSDLNEYKIEKYRRARAQVDFYGVGTDMITAKPVAALSGVYKIVEDNMGPRIKLSESKQTYPGKKQVYRVEENGCYAYDILELDGFPCDGYPLLSPMVENGVRVREQIKLDDIREYSLRCVAKLPVKTRRVKATPYEVKIGARLEELTERLVAIHS